jgi:protein involved in polysaccharide export with SLBB domain
MRRSGLAILTGALIRCLVFSNLILLSMTPYAQSQPNLPTPTPQPTFRSPPAAPTIATDTTAPSRALNSSATVQDENYKLGSGDKLRIVVYGESDLGGEYLVAGNGLVELPLLGQMPAAGMTLYDFQTAIGKKFVSEGYLKDPRVSVEVENYRPFYIIGEVKAPGQYAYISGMSVLTAVALAGGYTYRADDRTAYVRKNGDGKEVAMPADQSTKINPGDIIRIDERIF